MEIRKLNMQALADLMNSGEADRWSALPISRLRLLSQMNNPFLHPEDIIMIVVVENNDLLGYMGALPDELIDGSGKHHIAWASCIWIHPRKRGTGLGRRLTEELNSTWDGKLILTEFTPVAEAIYRSMGVFKEFTSRKGFRFFFRPVFYNISSRRNSRYSVLLPILKIADLFINIFQLIRIKFFIAANKKFRARFTKINVEDTRLWEKTTSVFSQSAAKWHWLSNFAWLSHDRKTEQKEYFFSTFVKRYELGAGQVLDANNIPSGSVVYTVLDNDMKIIDVSFTGGPQDEKDFVKAITCFICRARINTVLSFSETFNILSARHRMVYFFKKRRTRRYLIGASFMEKLQLKYPVVVEDYDGDVFFT